MHLAYGLLIRTLTHMVYSYAHNINKRGENGLFTASSIVKKYLHIKPLLKTSKRTHINKAITAC